jgi:hypothetical protein
LVLVSNICRRLDNANVCLEGRQQKLSGDRFIIRISQENEHRGRDDDAGCGPRAAMAAA